MKFSVGRLKSVRSKKAAYYLAIPILLAGIVAYVWHRMESPAYAPVDQTNITDAAPVTDKLIVLQNNYFSIVLNRDFKLVSTAPTSGGQLKYYSYHRGGGQPLSLIMYVIPAPSSIVADNDYNTYVTKPKVYKMSNLIYGSEVVDIATRKTGGHEVNALWLHGKSYLLALKLSTSDSSVNLSTAMKDLLNSVQWKVGNG